MFLFWENPFNWSVKKKSDHLSNAAKFSPITQSLEGCLLFNKFTPVQVSYFTSLQRYSVPYVCAIQTNKHLSHIFVWVSNKGSPPQSHRRSWWVRGCLTPSTTKKHLFFLLHLLFQLKKLWSRNFKPQTFTVEQVCDAKPPRAGKLSSWLMHY